MPLIVESGSGKTDAESYVSVSDADAYWADRNDSTWSNASTGAKEAALRNAAEYLDGTYTWRGTKATRDQGLDWPRTGVIDEEGYQVNSNIVPEAVKAAQYRLALEALSADLLAATDKGAVKRERTKADVIETETEYQNSSPQKQYPFVDRLLAGLITGQTGGVVVRLLRA